MIRTLRLPATVVAVLLLGAGCTPDTGGTPDAVGTTHAATPSTATAPSPSPDDVATTASMSHGSSTVDIGVHALARTGDRLVLTLDLSAGTTTDQSLVAIVGSAWSSDYVDAREYDGVRLVDLVGDTVTPTAYDADGRSVVAEVTPDDATGETLQIVFGDPGGDELAVYLPKVGLLEDVPVVDGPAPDPDPDAPLDLDAVAEAPVSPMESYSYDTAEQTRTERSGETTTIALAADVLFDSSSAKLDKKAENALEKAAAQIADHAPGTVSVVGHTDDVDTTASNQRLSERRARAVADRLGTLVDEDDYPFDVSGKGETEPLTSAVDADGRALNRRVELRIDTPERETTTVTAVAPVAYDGPVATGADGVEIMDGQTPIRVTAPAARVVDGHLVVTVDVERLDDAVDSAFGLGSFGYGGVTLPDHFTTVKTTGGIAVMTGSVATLPAFYRVADDAAAFPLADVRTNARIDGGQVRRVEMVYPRGTDVGATVTIQLLGPGGLRLTDIPVAG